ncbi:MAG: hypothetical protein ACI9B9_000469 [Halioglobus sp.]|jgi:hypothetical protein
MNRFWDFFPIGYPIASQFVGHWNLSWRYLRGQYVVDSANSSIQGKLEKTKADEEE